MPRPYCYIKLTDEQRNEIETCLRVLRDARRWRVRKRVNAIYLSDQRWKVWQICQHLEASKRSVRRWFSLYRSNGLNGLVKWDC